MIRTIGNAWARRNDDPFVDRAGWCNGRSATSSTFVCEFTIFGLQRLSSEMRSVYCSSAVNNKPPAANNNVDVDLPDGDVESGRGHASQSHEQVIARRHNPGPTHSRPQHTCPSSAQHYSTYSTATPIVPAFPTPVASTAISRYIQPADHETRPSSRVSYPQIAA